MGVFTGLPPLVGGTPKGLVGPQPVAGGFRHFWPFFPPQMSVFFDPKIDPQRDGPPSPPGVGGALQVGGAFRSALKKIPCQSTSHKAKIQEQDPPNKSDSP